jgi:hypothetical protein
MDLRPTNFPYEVAEGDNKIVALRTWEGIDKDGGILAWYTNTIRKARSTIYVENQFPFQNEFITRIVCKRLQEPSEVNIGITSGLLSKELRTRLWCEHLGLVEKTGDSTKNIKRTASKKCGQNGENWSLNRMLTTQILKTLIVDSKSGRRQQIITIQAFQIRVTL